MAEKVKIIIEAQDRTRGAIRGATAGLKRLGKTAVVAAAAGIAAAGAGMAAASVKMLDLGADAVETASLLQNSLGPATEGLNERLREFARESNRSFFELQQGSATFVAMTRSMGATQEGAADLGASFTEMATDLGSFFNVPTEQALADIQGALAGSSETVQKYGIDVRETTLKQMALNQGLIETASDTLPRLVRAQLIQEAIQRQATDAMGDAARTAGSFSNMIRGLKGQVRDAATEIGIKLIPTGERLLRVFQAILPALKSLSAGFFAIFANIVDVGIEFVKSLAQGLGVNFDTLAEDGAVWGENFVVALAEGMAAAASAVVSVLNQIGQIISHWLSPGSPPLLLPNLDKWGASAMTEWMQGWLDGDFSVFDEVAGIVEGFIRKLDIPDQNVIPRIMGSRAAIADVITQVRQLGTVSQESLTEIFDSAGIANQQIRDYMSTLFDVEAATAQVQRANERLTRAQESMNRVQERFAAIIDPLQAQLSTLQHRERDVRDRERLREISKELNDEELTARERMMLQLEKERIQLEMKIRNREMERDTAIDAAQAEVDAAQEQVSQAETQLANAQALAQVQRDILGIHQENVNLLSEQRSILDGLVGAVGGVGEAIKDKVGKALKEIPQIGQDVAAGMGGMAGEIATQFDGIFERVSEKFEPLKAQVRELGETWAGVFQGLQDRIDPIIGDDGILARFGLDIEDVTKAFIALIAAIIVFKAVGAIVGFVGTIIAAFKGLHSILMLIGGAGGSLPVIIALMTGPVGVAAALAVAAIAALIHKFGGAREAIDAVAETFTGSGTFGPTGPMVLALEAMAKFMTTWLEERSEAITTTLQMWSDTVTERLQAISDWFTAKLGEAEAAVNSVLDAARNFYNWLRSHVFSFRINLPSLPDWATPGSPLPIHAAWQDFARDMSRINREALAPIGGGANQGAVNQSTRNNVTINIHGGGQSVLAEVEQALARAGLRADQRRRI